MAKAFDRLTFETAQAARVSWFFGQKILAARLTRKLPAPARVAAQRMMPDRRRILADLRELLAQDWRNIEAGYYMRPDTWPDRPMTGLRRAIDFFADLEAVDARRHGSLEGGSADRRLAPPPSGDYPRYYLQKFHFQSDGYLSAASAARYDHQVEVLFGGGAAAMRRQALVPLRQAILDCAGGQGRARLLDIACGTGQFLREVKTNYPRLAVSGLDLSAPYLAEASRNLAAWSRVALVESNAEAMPFADGEFDIVTCIYLFHELPPRVRRVVVGEIRRVLRPGGVLIFVDSLQTGDLPDYDAMLDYFPVAFHEPYYASYLREDLDRLWQPGFAAIERVPAYLSKIVSYRRVEGPNIEHNI